LYSTFTSGDKYRSQRLKIWKKEDQAMTEDGEREVPSLSGFGFFNNNVTLILQYDKYFRFI
jgi:hypothetical protein